MRMVLTEERKFDVRGRPERVNEEELYTPGIWPLPLDLSAPGPRTVWENVKVYTALSSASIMLYLILFMIFVSIF